MLGLGQRVFLRFRPASQESPHVGSAGFGVVSLRGAPFSLPIVATAFVFFDSCRADRCLLLIGGGRFMHLVVLHVFQGAGRDLDSAGVNQSAF